MIQTNELRIGNLLLLNGQQCMVTSLGIDKVDVVSWPAGSKLENNLGDLSYLPLSEEFMTTLSGDETGYLTMSELERTTDSSDIVMLSTVECYLHDDGFLRVCAYEYDKQPDGTINTSDDVITLGYKHIRNVHQLQNLYFAITGKELTGVMSYGL